MVAQPTNFAVVLPTRLPCSTSLGRVTKQRVYIVEWLHSTYWKRQDFHVLMSVVLIPIHNRFHEHTSDKSDDRYGLRIRMSKSSIYTLAILQ